MHLFVMVESYDKGFEEFKEWLKEQRFKMGGHPKIREIKLYDINIPHDELERYTDLLFPMEVKEFDSPWKNELIREFLNTSLPIQDIEELKKKSADKISKGIFPPGRYGPMSHEEIGKIKKRHWLHLFMLGKMDDGFDATGVETI